MCIRDSHQIEEVGDTLWMCTLGLGVIKAAIKGTPDNPVLTDVKKYILDNGAVSSNQFFSITRDASGNLYFSNRGKGVFRYSNGKMTSIPLKNRYDTNGVRDVFDAVADRNALWVGTGKGLIKRTSDSENHFAGHQFGFPNNTIHEIMSMPDGKIWISTNNGIVSFNPENEETQTYAGNYGINVTEFSDGASAYAGNTMMFGGIMEQTHQLEVIVNSLKKIAKGPAALVGLTEVTCVLSNATMPEQYISIVVPGRMYAEEYHKMGVHPAVLSSALEGAGTVTSALIPWNTCGVFIKDTLNIAPWGAGGYGPWAIFNWLMPIINWLCVLIGWTLKDLAGKPFKKSKKVAQ